jgi:hypothetical protein
MCLHLQPCERISVSPVPQRGGLVPQSLDSDEYSDPISNLLNTHLLQDLLVTFQQIVTIEVVGSK